MSALPLRGLLFASLAVNLVLIGVVGGAALGGLRLAPEQAAPEAPEKWRAAAPRVGGFLATLDPQTRRAIGRDLRAAYRDSRDMRAAQRAAREEVAAAATAEPYDAQRMRAAFAQVRESSGRVQAGWHEAVAQSMTQLSVEERRALVQNYLQRSQSIRARVMQGVNEGGAPQE